MRARVLMIYTGGTISMVPSDIRDPRSPLVPADATGLRRHIADLAGEIEWDLVGLDDGCGGVMAPLDSSDVGPTHWILLARQIAAAYLAYDGFIVLHGTDTMAYSAAALSFLCQNLDKPVVFTGSQSPIFEGLSDGPRNLALALALAGWPARLAPRIPEVLICFGDVALRGNRAIKISTNSYQGFASPNLPPLARLGLGIQVETSLLRPRPPAGAAFAVHDRLEPAVMTVSLYPGITPGQLDAMLNVPDIAGYVLRCFGAGNAPGDPALLAAVGSAIMAGRVIVAITACPGGGVAPGLYAASHGLLAQGVIPGADLTEAAALTKLAWLLDHGGPAAALRLMARDCRGELTPG